MMDVRDIIIISRIIIQIQTDTYILYPYICHTRTYISMHIHIHIRIYIICKIICGHLWISLDGLGTISLP